MGCFTKSLPSHYLSQNWYFIIHVYGYGIGESVLVEADQMIFVTSKTSLIQTNNELVSVRSDGHEASIASIIGGDHFCCFMSKCPDKYPHFPFFHLLPSPHPMWMESCPFSILHNSCQIYFSYTYLINQVQTLCHRLSFHKNCNFCWFFSLHQVVRTTIWLWHMTHNDVDLWLHPWTCPWIV